jgi:hypothetical protein
VIADGHGTSFNGWMGGATWERADRFASWPFRRLGPPQTAGAGTQRTQSVRRVGLCRVASPDVLEMAYCERGALRRPATSAFFVRSASDLSSRADDQTKESDLDRDVRLCVSLRVITVDATCTHTCGPFIAETAVESTHHCVGGPKIVATTMARRRLRTGRSHCTTGSPPTDLPFVV